MRGLQAIASQPVVRRPSPWHSDVVLSACAGPEPESVVTGDDSGAILVSLLVGDDTVAVSWHWPGAHKASVTRLAVHGASGVLVSASRDRSIGLWRVGESQPLARLTGHELAITAVCVDQASSELRHIVSGGRDCTVRLYDATRSEAGPLAHNNTASNVVTGLAWLNGEPTCVLQSSEDLSLRVWDVRALARPAQVWSGFSPNIARSCAVADDGRMLLTTHNGFDASACEVLVHDRRAGRVLHRLEGHSRCVHDGAFARLPRGSGAVSAQQQQQQLQRQNNDSEEYELSDGDTGAAMLVAVGVSASGEARAWDCATGEALAVDAAPGTALYGCAVVGDVLVACGAGAMVGAWRWRPAEQRFAATLVAQPKQVTE